MAEADCIEAARLQALYTAIVSGDSVQVARFGEDEVRYYKADLTALRRLIDAAQARCTGKRRRFAMRGRYTHPY